MGGLVRATWWAVSTTSLSAATIQVGRHKTCGSQKLFRSTVAGDCPTMHEWS
jgi:hypothetical protein